MKKKKNNYYKPLRVNFWSNNYIQYKSNSDKNRILSVEECLDKIKPYLKDIINDLRKSDERKIQLTIIINFIFSNDDKDEQRVMHSKSGNIEIMTSDDADEVTKKRYDSLKNKLSN